jgi:hypothetical protein
LSDVEKGTGAFSAKHPPGLSGKRLLSPFSLGVFRARPRLWTGLAIFLAVFYGVAATAPGPGLTWDEAIYLGQAATYLDWVKTIPSGGLSRESLQRDWQREVKRDSTTILLPSGDAHPPLGKAVTAVFMGTLGGALNVILAARMGAACCFALLCLLLYLFMERRFGRVAAIGSVLSLCLMPRVFAHAHLATLEMPLLLTGLVTVIAFEKGLTSRRWSALTGLFFGGALLTRFDAVLLPVILVPWGLLFYRRKAIPNILAMLVIAPLVFIAGWPALWVNTFPVLHGYVLDKLQRMPIPWLYFGQLYVRPPAPWHYPFVMTLVTTPVAVLAGIATGMAVALRRKAASSASADRPVTFLLMLAAFLPLCLVALPGAPKYDGTRLFLPAFPFLAALAGIGTAAVWGWLCAKGRRRLAMAIGGGVLVLLIVPIVLLHPFELSYYNLLIGGPRGAASLGKAGLAENMEITYWGDTFNDDALKFVKERLPNGGKVALAAVGEFVAAGYRATGQWPEGVQTTNFERGDWDLLVVVPRVGWLAAYQRPVWEYVNRHQPVWVESLPLQRWDLVPFITHVRLPVCLIYERAPRTSGLQR